MADARNRPPQVVVVTGAGAGLGRAIARCFAYRGASIGLISREPSRLEDTKSEVEAAGGRAIVLPLDVADSDAVEQAAALTEQAFGPIDIWVNNAMVSVFSPVKDTPADEFKRVTEVTYLGYVYGTLAALRRMLPRDHGCIVQVGSALSYRSIPLQAAYCAAKHAVVGFTDSLRSELHHERSAVRVTVVHMPALNTPQFSWAKSRMPRKAQPVPPIFQPEVGAEAVYWATRHREREVLVGWPSVKAIWGQRVIPGLLDRYLAGAAWEGQMHNGPDEPERAHNLWQPVSGLARVHGAFDKRAGADAPHVWITTHAAALAAIAATGLVGLIAAATRRRPAGR